jgi:hypothetical protein
MRLAHDPFWSLTAKKPLRRVMVGRISFPNASVKSFVTRREVFLAASNFAPLSKTYSRELNKERS